MYTLKSQPLPLLLANFAHYCSHQYVKTTQASNISAIVALHIRRMQSINKQAS